MNREFKTFAEASRFASDYCRTNRVSARVIRSGAGCSVISDTAPNATPERPPYRQSTQLNPSISDPNSLLRTPIPESRPRTPWVPAISPGEEAARQLRYRQILLERELADRPPPAAEIRSPFRSHESCHQCGGDGGDGGAGGRCPRCGGNGLEP